MAIMSSRAFNQDRSGAKREAAKAPLIITDRGEPAFVLMSYTSYETLKGRAKTVAEALAMPDGGDLDVDFGRVLLPLRDIALD